MTSISISIILLLISLVVLRRVLRPVMRARPRRDYFEHLQKIGMLRFVLTAGLIFAASLGIPVFIISPPMPWYILALLVYVFGLVLAAVMWFILTRYHRV
jgi:hypothetical protein